MFDGFPLFFKENPFFVEINVLGFGVVAMFCYQELQVKNQEMFRVFILCRCWVQEEKGTLEVF